MAREFQDLRQTTQIVPKITTMFRERGLLVTQFVADEDMKKDKYHEILRGDIRQFVSRSSCSTLEDMIVRATERDIDLETERKRKSNQVQGLEGSGKRPMVFDSKSRGQQGQSRCSKCDKTLDGACTMGGSGCF